MQSYEQLFKRATGFEPLPYQTRLACDGPLPSRLSIPTGLGKTAAVILAWLWRRRFGDDKTKDHTPRRLVYCLPMRVLVEQTADEASRWLRALQLDDAAGGGVGLHVLMGGDIDGDWDQYPDRDAIIIGTQDMLLSRALNRGYAMSRYRWPVQFGLLNSDCLWVMDEVQLMGDGLATSTQLQALRRQLGAYGPTASLWMSATIRDEWLQTVDVELSADAAGGASLEDDDRKTALAKKRLESAKRVIKAHVSRSRTGEDEARYIADQHRKGCRTIVVVNTVDRAMKIHQELERADTGADLVLIHSRFRPEDKKRQLERLSEDPGENGIIAVSTQVIEAGVDLSAARMFTDLAPWPSLVQRFGRCNRYGDLRDAAIHWFDITPDGRDGTVFLPYGEADLDAARVILEGLQSAAPADLPIVDGAMRYRHVIRRRDVIDLFDTTPDLAGADIDVSRFIRETDDHTLQVFFRDIESSAQPGPDEPQPGSAELCSVAVSVVREAIGKKRHAWTWDYLDSRWVWARDVAPGQVVLLRAADGGYSEDLGFTGNSRHVPAVIASRADCPESNDDERWSEQRNWLSVAEHTDQVCAELDALTSRLGLLDDEALDALLLAGRWHDRGKAHPVFQEALLGDGAQPPTDGVWAKTAGGVACYSRRGFRHELASALAMIANGATDLAAYLAAAHHGKVRASIRSLPAERRPPSTGARFARGIWDGDVLPPTDLGGGVVAPEATLDLSIAEIGDGPQGASWLERVLGLRDHPSCGPFRLGYLEAVLRVADWRASGAASRAATTTSEVMS
jgi:CRISPR-associated endonuclease/helicase Cas3